MSNYLAQFTKLSNHYFVLRHGKSLANEQGIILSDPASGTKGYGLSNVGKEQVKQSVLSALQEGQLDNTTQKTQPR